MSATIDLTQFESSRQLWIPKDYQKRAMKLLLSQGSAGLFLDPGLGKTSIVLAAFKILKNKGLAKKMLVVAPLRPAYKVWPDEIKKWADFIDLTYTVVHGNGKAHALSQDVDVYIINPEGLLWLFNESAKRQLPEFDILVIDESTKFKDSQTRRFKLLKPRLPNFSRRWILTGTPVPNGLMDLFSQIYILDLGRALGRFITHYRLQYFHQGGYGLYEWRPNPGSFEKVVEKISPLILRLSAEDYLEMPELIFSDVAVDLDEQAKRIYKEVEDGFFAEIEGGNIVAANAAAAGTKCRQIANGAVYVDGDEWAEIHDAKLDALEDLLEELAGAPTLVLYEFRHDLERIKARFGDVPVLGAGTTPKQMEKVIDRFNAGDIPILLGHPASMGHGLNLQGSCHHIIWFGITWNLELYDQAIARVYRQGQASDRVFVYNILARETLDERVLEVLTKKDRTQQTLLAAIEEYREAHLNAHP